MGDIRLEKESCLRDASGRRTIHNNDGEQGTAAIVCIENAPRRCIAGVGCVVSAAFGDVVMAIGRESEGGKGGEKKGNSREDRGWIKSVELVIEARGLG